MYRVILAIGNEEIESLISQINCVEVIEQTDDLSILEDILEYLEADYVILNSLLNKKKSIRIATAAKERGIKVITLLEDMGKENRDFIASMVGSGAKAFVLFNELDNINDILNNYPDEFDFATLAVSQTSQTEAKTPDFFSGIINPVSGKRGLFAKKNIEIKGAVSIGVFSLSRGAGSTRTAVKIAEQLAGHMKVACIEFDGRQDLEYIYDFAMKADYTAPEDDESAEMIIDLIYGSGDHEVIVIDFGNLFEISNQGVQLNLKTLNKSKISEFQRCRYTVGLGFAEEWHSGKLQLFEQEEFQSITQNGKHIFVLSGDAAQIKAVKRDYEFKIFDRSEDIYLDYILNHFGIESKRKRKIILPRKEKAL